MSTFSERLKHARDRKGITQTRAGELAGVNYKTLSNWERGVVEPDLLSLMKLSEIYEVSTDWLIKGYETDYESPVWTEGWTNDLNESLRQLDESMSRIPVEVFPEEERKKFRDETILRFVNKLLENINKSKEGESS